MTLTKEAVLAPPLTILMIVAAAGSLALALNAPLATTVIGLIIFGVLHNVLELRYVTGRFAGILTGRFLILLLVLITGIVVCRLLAGYAPRPAQVTEIGVGYLILIVGCRFGLRGWRFALATGLLVMAALASFSFPAYHFVVLTHLHNLVPLFFLWEWAARIPDLRARLIFRLSQVLWIVLIPLLILAGAVDSWLALDADTIQRFVADPSRVIAAAAPPGSAEVIGLRFLTMFAFMQTMHYVVWVAFLPKFAPDAARAFESRVPWLTGRRAWLVGAGGGAFLAVLFLSDYFQGKALYGALATYHAYLEFPVLLALLMAPAIASRSAISPSPR